VLRKRARALETKDNAVTAVVLDDGSRLPCDFLVLATGCAFSLPTHSAQACLDAADRRTHYATAHTTLAAAPSLLVVGGGEVGVEAAAEAAARWPSKSITLVSSAKCLLPGLPTAAGRRAAAWLAARGVQVVLGERIADWGGARAGAGFVASPTGSWTLTTAGGVRLSAACVWDATGGRETTSALLSGCEGAVGARGGAATDSALRIRGLNNAVAAGDAVAAPSWRGNALMAERAGAHAAAAVLAMASGARPPRFEPPPRIAALSLGPRDGLLVVNQLVLSGGLWGVAASLVKAVIQALQMGMAMERWGFGTLWRAMEAVTVALGRRLFLPRPEERRGEGRPEELMDEGSLAAWAAAALH